MKRGHEEKATQHPVHACIHVAPLLYSMGQAVKPQVNIIICFHYVLRIVQRRHRLQQGDAFCFGMAASSSNAGNSKQQASRQARWHALGRNPSASLD